jgi:hypothetical protein
MSIAALKRKTFANNPREAPLSGRNGFSLHGALRGNYIGQGNLAFRSKHKNKTGNAYTIAVCNNDPSVLKTTVMNTRGMLSKKLKGIDRVYSLAPFRENLENEECGCPMGRIIENAPPYSGCGGNGGGNGGGVGPLSQNWVKHPTNPNGDQGMYIEKIVKLNRKKSTNSSISCLVNTAKSYNGIVGVLTIEGYNAVQNVRQRYNLQKYLSQEQIDELVTTNAIVPFTTLGSSQKSNCYDINNITFIPCITKYKSTKKPCTSVKNIKITKPGITTIDYGTYISKRLQEKKFISPQQDCNRSQPNPDTFIHCGATTSWNNNITPYKQISYNTNLKTWTFV